MIAVDKPVLTGKRLIEDAIPIDVISRTSASEKVGGRIGHPASLHLWWARRPLAASRAAVYATLVPADGHQRNAAELAEFFDSLCRWGGPESAIRKAREEVLAANGGQPPESGRPVRRRRGDPARGCPARLRGHCERTQPRRAPDRADDARVPPGLPRDSPRTFAGGARSGSTVPGPSSPTSTHRSRAPWRHCSDNDDLFGGSAADGRTPLAYLWTRTVRCPNPALAEHRVDLVRQTWLGKKKGRMVALKPIVDREALTVTYRGRRSPNADALGFDPAAELHAWAGHVPHLRRDRHRRLRQALKVRLVAWASRRSQRWYSSLGPRSRVPAGRNAMHSQTTRTVWKRLAELPVDAPEELLPAGDHRRSSCTTVRAHPFPGPLHPKTTAGSLHSRSGCARRSTNEMLAEGADEGRAAAVATALALVINKVADHCSALCRWIAAPRTRGAANTYARQALPMVWDFAEANPFGGSSGDVRKYLKETADLIETLAVGQPVRCVRGSATSLPLPDESQDAVITDPPYYDNISYADLSDFFYVWLKRSVGFLYPDDLGGQLTPKRNEAVVAPYRHHGRKDEARVFYEQMMAGAFAEAHRVLKPGAPLVCIYAHKTTLGWATLVEALRTAGFTITEAWPLDTEMPERVGRPGHRKSRIVDLPGRAQTGRRRRGGQRGRRYGRTRQDHRRAARAAPAAWCDRRRPRHRHRRRGPARIDSLRAGRAGQRRDAPRRALPGRGPGEGSGRDLRLTRQRRPCDALLPRGPVLLRLRGGALRRGQQPRPHDGRRPRQPARAHRRPQPAGAQAGVDGCAPGLRGPRRRSPVGASRRGKRSAQLFWTSPTGCSGEPSTGHRSCVPTCWTRGPTASCCVRSFRPSRARRCAPRATARSRGRPPRPSACWSPGGDSSRTACSGHEWRSHGLRCHRRQRA